MIYSLWYIAFLLAVLCFQYTNNSRTNVRNQPSVRRIDQLPSTFDYIIFVDKIYSTFSMYNTGFSNLSDDDQFKTYLCGSSYSSAITNTGQHLTGSCKMGTDFMAVVDSRLRVHGVTNLRVADASIMPSITTGNTQAPVYMIGEKAAQMILDDVINHSVKCYVTISVFLIPFFAFIARL